MDPVVKKSKKKARKAGAETEPAVQTDVNPPANKYTSSWEEEQLVETTSPRSRQDFPR
jgi:hypothetical protein